MKQNKILFVGCGHMGGALLEGWINFSGLAVEDFIIAEPSEEIRKTFKKRGFKTISDISVLPKSAKIRFTVLAVRPNVLAEILPALAEILPEKSPVLSIAAGKKISFIEKYLPGHGVIRIMPNMAVAQGLGVCGLYASAKTAPEDKTFIYELMEPCSALLEVKKESDLNKITALGGSSPAYFYASALALAQAAEDYNFPEEFTSRAAVNVFLGSALLFAKSGGSLKETEDKIATKGGTTEAAIKEFDKNAALTKLFKRAMKACVKRAEELSK